MDPSAPPNYKKDGNRNLPPDIEFPVDARVIVKFYKVVGTDDDDGKAVQTKYLNTKVIKVETSLNQQDLYSKSLLMSAIQRDCDLKRLSTEESIQNPRFEVSVKRQEAGEIFTVTKMGLVVKRLQKLKDRSDTILVEVKEQIISFQPKQPTIKLIINGDPKAAGTTIKGRMLGESVVKGLNDGLKKVDHSRYDKEKLSAENVLLVLHQELKELPRLWLVILLITISISVVTRRGRKKLERSLRTV